jgi:hypothetical protein
MLSKEASMKIERLAALTFAAAALCAVTSVSALAKGAKVPAWKHGHVHGFVGCLTQESTEPGYFDLTKAKSDEGADVGTLRLTGHFLGIDDPKDSLNKRVHVTGVYVGR